MGIKQFGVFVLAVLLFSFIALTAVALTDGHDEGQLRSHLKKTFMDGNYKDAYDGYRKLVLDANSDPAKVDEDLNMAVQSLRQLGRVSEVDELLESAIDAHPENWRLLRMAAQQYLQIDKYGFLVAGQFERGNRRGGGEVVNATQRDRVRALQLIVRAIDELPENASEADVANLYLELARAVLNNRGYAEAWRLQYLTDLNELPDYDEGWYYGRQSSGAPVDEEGNPVFYHVPASWEAAQTDGERWRWALSQVSAVGPNWAETANWEFGNFLYQQFGVQTMAYRSPRIWHLPADEEHDKDESGTYALHTLKENETIAKLATGVKRIELPDEFNFIKIFQQLAGKPDGGFGENSLNQLAQIFENRRQFPKAADYWRQSIERYGDRNHKKARLEQIVSNWGSFEPVSVQPAGQGASVEYRFRNGTAVDFEAHEIDIATLLSDVKKYLKSNPKQINWEFINIGNIGYSLVHRNEEKYLGRQVAQWELELEPLKDHFDRRITVTTPLSKPGAYLVKAKMKDGNTTTIILWVSDTAIAKKQLSDGTYYFVADAVTGEPIEKANVEFFGYRQQRVGRRNNQFAIDTRNFAEFTDADGQVIGDEKAMPRDHTWIVIARKGERLAYLGFSGVWYNENYDYTYNQTKVFTITDRPVYRPNQSVKFKFWIETAKYDQPDTSAFAGQTFRIEIHDPKREKVLEKDFTADAYGGIAGEYELPSDAPLGAYSLNVKNYGGGSFRVEEYKKPEFEVTVDAPDEPVMLGEQITAKINAKYYFGSPVTEGKVKYKVLRTSYTERWYPIGPWDWLYGRGYWWFAPDYTWYPGWGRWGCEAPVPWWWHRAAPPPEVVSEQEVEIGADGTVDVEIDTAVAKEIHPDQDHRYQIMAEVTDQSRRTITGEGTVLVARKPFQVFAWVDRGYFRVGDTVKARFKAHTLDSQPVEGAGKLDLYKISYDENNEPVETLVQTWDLPTNDQGEASQQITATAAGQYRLSYTVTDAAEHAIEGGYLFTVVGDGFDAADYRFNSLELIPEKREYHPGEKIRLLVNTDRVGSTVVLFVRPSNSVYLRPTILRLDGKSTVHEIDVVQKDMPNFFLEAFTISDASIHAVTKEIIVPPEKRVINVAVEPSAEEYRPGEEATVKVKLTDQHGEPVVGSTVLSIYDKSVEYIAGGSNVGSIKEFFWKWRRSHYPQTESNLLRYFGNMNLPGEIGMSNLGVFGATVADEVGKSNAFFADADRPRGGVNEPTSAMPAAEMAREGVSRLSALGAPAANDSLDARFGGGVAEKRQEQTGDFVEATVRKEFADTAFWAAALETNDEGFAEVALTMPENLTAWKVKLWSMGHGTRVGEGEAEVVTRKNLLVRLQAPRFFVETDEVVLSANVHNYLPTKKTVQVSLETDNEVLALPSDTVRTIEIEPNNEARVDWRVRVALEGEAIVRMKALTDEESDAIEMSFPAYVHGMYKTEAWTGVIRPDDERQAISVHVPSERRIEDARLEIRFSPTLAGAMVDTLPYLVDYPYGCTEQTLSRFLPTVITQKILLEMNLDLKAIQEKRTNLNAQEIGDDRERARRWQRYERNPVFDEAEVVRMAKDGVEALTNMQLSDGGWGWFSGYGERSSAHTTAYVVHGLQIAKQNDLALVPGVLERGIDWLKRHQDWQIQLLKNADGKKEPYKNHADNLDAFVYMVLVDADVANDEMRDFLYRDRTKLAVYSKAMFGLALDKQSDQERLAMILRNIEQYLVHDEENQTSYLDLPGGYWWYWYGSEYEAHAYYLKLLCRTDPKGQTASGLVKYLLNNRKHATYWNSTRDTAICIEAMADFLRASGEAKPDQVVEIWMDGRKQKEVAITADNLFTFDNKLVLEGADVTTGVHEIELRRRGTGPVYFNAYLTNFTLEDFITRAGLEIKVERNYYKLHEVDKEIKVAGSRGQAVDQKVEKYERERIPNLATLKSGDLVEIELVIDSKNDYEYLIFEDMKAAGFEPVDVRSGYTGNEMGAYVEFRDNRVVFFVNRLARGKHSVTYRVRAEIPGRFSALPTLASAMYAPELKANSDEIKVAIDD